MVRQTAEESQTQYWLAVVACLIDEHKLDPRDAITSVGEYRDRMQSVGALEIVYHWEPEETAESVAGRGYRTPPEAIPGRSVTSAT